MGDEASGGRSAGLELRNRINLPTTEEFAGSVPLNLNFKVIRDGLVVDTNTGVSEMLVTAKVYTPKPFKSEFVVERPVLVDESVIEEASKNALPNNASELLPKIIGEFMKEETRNLDKLKAERLQSLSKTSSNIARASIFTGLLTGVSGSATVALVESGNDWVLATGWSTFIFGALAVVGFKADRKDQMGRLLKHGEIEESEQNLTLLRLVQEGVKNDLVMDDNVGYTAVALVNEL